MYIIFSPTKLMNLTDTINVHESYRFKEATNELLNYFYDMSIEELSLALDLKSSQLKNQVYKMYHGFKIRNHPLYLYQGQSFQQLDFKSYADNDHAYLNEHFRIISALYGVLKPFDVIFPYRLDFKAKTKYNLKNYWRDIINYDLGFADVIVNLASNEFSSLVKHDNVINIIFKQNYGGNYKSISTLSKQARGIYLDWMVKNKITTASLKDFNLSGYSFCEEESDDNNLVFLKG